MHAAGLLQRGSPVAQQQQQHMGSPQLSRFPNPFPCRPPKQRCNGEFTAFVSAWHTLTVQAVTVVRMKKCCSFKQESLPCVVFAQSGHEVHDCAVWQNHLKAKYIAMHGAIAQVSQPTYSHKDYLFTACWQDSLRPQLTGRPPKPISEATVDKLLAASCLDVMLLAVDS